MTMVPIGRFSQMTRLSVKALRLYDEKGLLEPARIDPSSGYRYYALTQAPRAEAIRVLRMVDMPLDEIAEVLAADDQELVEKRLQVHRERLLERLAADERMLSYLETLMRREEGIMPYTVTIETVDPQTVIATKRHTTLAKVGEDIAVGFGMLAQSLGTEVLQPTGAPLIVFHDVIDEETDGDIELCIPVGRLIDADGEVYGREVEAATVATTVHHGRYSEIAPAYHTITGWISEHGHEITGPPREIYLNDPQSVPEEEQLTRVEFPIAAP